MTTFIRSIILGYPVRSSTKQQQQQQWHYQGFIENDKNGVDLFLFLIEISKTIYSNTTHRKKKYQEKVREIKSRKKKQ